MALKKDFKTNRYFEHGYVICKDKFLSGWGDAEGGTSFYALGLDRPEDAEIVIRNAKDRGDMIGCQVRKSYFYLERKRGNNHLSVVDRDEASRWYESGRPFKKR